MVTIPRTVAYNEGHSRHHPVLTAFIFPPYSDERYTTHRWKKAQSTLPILSIPPAYQWLMVAEFGLAEVVTDISVVLERNAAYLAWIMKRPLEGAQNGFVYEIRCCQKQCQVVILVIVVG